jgi:sugar-phosphatase
MDLLESLLQETWAVVTSCSEVLAVARLRKAGLPIPKYMVTSDDVSFGKPNPEPFLVGAQLLGIQADRCLVIEDSLAGVEAGLRALMQVVWIKKNHDMERTMAFGADLVVNRLSELSFKEGKGDHQFVVIH